MCLSQALVEPLGRFDDATAILRMIQAVHHRLGRVGYGDFLTFNPSTVMPKELMWRHRHEAIGEAQFLNDQCDRCTLRSSTHKGDARDLLCVIVVMQRRPIGNGIRFYQVWDNSVRVNRVRTPDTRLKGQD